MMEAQASTRGACAGATRNPAIMLIVPNCDIAINDPATGWPREIFLAGAKDGTDMAASLDDASVVISVALQHGIPAAALAKSVARLPSAPLLPSDLAAPTGPAQTAPASVIGAVLDLLRELEDA